MGQTRTYGPARRRASVCVLCAAAVVASAGAPTALARPRIIPFYHTAVFPLSTDSVTFPNADPATGLDVELLSLSLTQPPGNESDMFPEPGMIVAVSLDSVGDLTLKRGVDPGRRHSVAMTRMEFNMMGAVGNGGPTTMQSFDTELVALSLTSPTLPQGWMLRESPTLDSLGWNTIAPETLADRTGGFVIDSFFSIFFELSVDGGQNWIPADGPMTVVEIPGPAPISMLGLSMAGAFAWRRRRAENAG